LRSLTRTPDPARALAWQAIAEFSVKERVASIRCPTLVIHGDADPNIPFAAGRALAEAIGHAEWLPFAGVGHDVPIERATELEERLRALFATQVPGARGTPLGP
jgi:pimeloyl-ACP methyl ester carboxylesterase